jgi:tetratricopeptide (TPR) repeat protein
MKNLIVFCMLSFCAVQLHAQDAKYKPNPKAKRLDDSAIKVFALANEAPAVYDRVGKLLETAVKIDPKYYEGWSNLLNFQGRTNQALKCLATASKMIKLFPNSTDALFNYSVMQCIMGRDSVGRKGFAKIVRMYESEMAKNPLSKNYNELLTQKGIALILQGKDTEGKSILHTVHSNETDPYKKSFIAYYINKTREEILDDKIPGH